VYSSTKKLFNTPEECIFLRILTCHGSVRLFLIRICVLSDFDGFPFINVVSENQGRACHIDAIFSQTVACKRHTETVWAD